MDSTGAGAISPPDFEQLKTIVSDGGVVTDPDITAAAGRDWTGRWVGSPPAVIYPGSTDEVVAVIGWCRANDVALIPQGGNTSMVGGSVPLAGEVVMNLGRLTAIDVDAAAGVITAQAGATLGAIQSAATAAGWSYGVDLGARDTATIGGTIATNAGGLRVLRFGDTRRQLLGIEAVTGTGEVVGDLRGLVKDNTGYHLPSLLAGSEGTLAVITRACVRLHPPPSATVVALVAFGSEAEAIEAIRPIRLGVSDLAALELFFADGLALVCRQLALSAPFIGDHPAYLLVEAAGPTGVTDRLAEGLADLHLSADSVAVAEDRHQRERLWRYREAHTEAISLLGIPHKLDITVPLSEMAGFITEVRSAVQHVAPDAHTWLFGHAGDGNIHVNITGADPDDPLLDATVLDLVVAHGGSISAEHGIGRAKAAYLHLNRTEAELALARRLKTAFDPDGILNPGAIFEAT